MAAKNLPTQPRVIRTTRQTKPLPSQPTPIPPIALKITLPASARKLPKALPSINTEDPLQTKDSPPSVSIDDGELSPVPDLTDREAWLMKTAMAQWRALVRAKFDLREDCPSMMDFVDSWLGWEGSTDENSWGPWKDLYEEWANEEKDEQKMDKQRQKERKETRQGHMNTSSKRGGTHSLDEDSEEDNSGQ